MFQGTEAHVHIFRWPPILTFLSWRIFRNQVWVELPTGSWMTKSAVAKTRVIKLFCQFSEGYFEAYLEDLAGSLQSWVAQLVVARWIEVAFVQQKTNPSISDNYEECCRVGCHSAVDPFSGKLGGKTKSQYACWGLSFKMLQRGFLHLQHTSIRLCNWWKCSSKH